jgi:peptidoglycan L-alanyl-D-glutamate endopeptidase CwlK
MAVLKQGSKGPEVTDLQTKIKAAGFDPGTIDGNFGAGTRDALIAFQQSKGLQADGKAGSQTMNALADGGAGGDPVLTELTRAASAPISNVTVALVSKIFPGTPVANIETNLPFVLQALAAAGLGDKDMVLMALATIRAETGNFTPLSEFKSKFNTSKGGHPFDLYDNRKNLGNLGPPDGDSFKGRGFIQLTGRANFLEHGTAIGLGDQLIKNPALANQPDIAAKLLASFLKNKEQAIRDALRNGDLKAARKLVNGGSHGLAEFTQAFNTGKELIA